MRARTYYLTVGAVVALNICVAAQYVSHAPTLDGWAVWNRVMLLDLGRLTLFDYLLGFFGAHPHSVVLFLSLLDHRLVNADQSLLAVADYAAIATFAIFCAHRYLAWARMNGASGGGVLLGGAAIAALATTLADSHVMTLPFQAVLAVSRLCYVLLLWWLIRSLRSGSALQLLVVTAFSCLAVTFHGTGPLFALIFLLVHLLRYAGLGRCLAGAAPLAVALLHAYFYKDGGELGNLGSIVSARGVIDASKALFAYFGGLLGPLWVAGKIGDTIVLLVGAAVSAFMAWLACHCLLGAAMKRVAGSATHRADDERLFAGALSLLVLLSSAAAAVLMTIRGGADAYRLTFDSPRYVAYSLLAYVLIVCTLVRVVNGKPRHKSLALVTAGSLGALGLYPAVAFSDLNKMDVHLNKAVAAMSVGMSPVEPPAIDLWPAARDDWYWTDALPTTVEHLMRERTGPWSHLPSLGQIYTGLERTPEISILATAKCPPSCPDGIVEFSGVVSARTDGGFLRSRTVALVNVTGEVIGFAAQVRPLAGSRRREFFGYLVADGAKPPEQVFVGPSDGAYGNDATACAASSVRPQRPQSLMGTACPASSAGYRPANRMSAAR